MKFVTEIAPIKEIENNTQEWFDREIADMIHACKKIFFKV